MKFDNDYPNDMVRRLVDALEVFESYMDKRSQCWSDGFPGSLMAQEDHNHRLAVAYQQIAEVTLGTIKKIEEMV